MEGKLLYILGLVLCMSCVIIVAKNESEKTLIESKNISSILNTTNLNQNIFSEGGVKITPEIETSDEPKKSKVKGRKGVSFENSSPSNESESSSSTSVTVQSTSISSSRNSNETLKLVTNTPATIKNASSEVSHPVTSATLSTTVKSTTTTSTTTTTTKKPMIRKPTITYSFDDYDAIKDSEKNINYNVAKEKSSSDPDPAPKASEDVDRAVLEEKRARKSYMIYLGLAVMLPLAVVAMNMAYKRVKTYLELREYQRVDFLVDGMYVS